MGANDSLDWIHRYSELSIFLSSFSSFFPPCFYRRSIRLPTRILSLLDKTLNKFLSFTSDNNNVFHSRSVKAAALERGRNSNLSNKTRKKASTDWWKEEKLFLSSWPNCLTRRKPEPETKFSLRKMDGLMLMTLWRENGSRNDITRAGFCWPTTWKIRKKEKKKRVPLSETLITSTGGKVKIITTAHSQPASQPAGRAFLYYHFQQRGNNNKCIIAAAFWLGRLLYGRCLSRICLWFFFFFFLSPTCNRAGCNK